MLTINEENMPDYTAAVSIQNSRRILKNALQKRRNGKFLRNRSRIRSKRVRIKPPFEQTAETKSNRETVKGTYRLRFLTPLCFVFGSNQKIPVAYFRLLGRRGDRKEPEPKTAISLLEKEGLKPDLVYVVTSPNALAEWADLKLNYQWILCYEDEIADVEKIEQKVAPQLLSLLKEYNVIMDCTSATKPATIAYYKLAQQLWVPLIYFYEEKNQLKWLISKETVIQKLNSKNVC